MEVTIFGPIIIDNLDEASANWIDREVKRRGTDKETVALHLIQKGIECEEQLFSLHTYEDMDSLTGTGTEGHATEFMCMPLVLWSGG